jgi:hypothetical protein
MALPAYNLRHLSCDAAWIVANGLTVKLITVGRGYVRPEVRVSLPPGPAQIVLGIDNREYTRNVTLPKGSTDQDYVIDVVDTE